MSKLRAVLLPVLLISFPLFVFRGGIHRGRKRFILGNDFSSVDQAHCHIDTGSAPARPALQPSFGDAIEPLKEIVRANPQRSILSARAPPLFAH